MVEGVGFQRMLNALEPRYNVPVRKYFSNTVIPALYEETRRGIVKELSEAAYVALTVLLFLRLKKTHLSIKNFRVEIC